MANSSEGGSSGSNIPLQDMTDPSWWRKTDPATKLTIDQLFEIKIREEKEGKAQGVLGSKRARIAHQSTTRKASGIVINEGGRDNNIETKNATRSDVEGKGKGKVVDELIPRDDWCKPSNVDEKGKGKVPNELVPSDDYKPSKAVETGKGKIVYEPIPGDGSPDDFDWDMWISSEESSDTDTGTETDTDTDDDELVSSVDGDCGGESSGK